MQETEKIWMNGELVDWAEARVHVGAHGLHYGTGVFEGIRCYDTERGPAVFRLNEHLAAAPQVGPADLHGHPVLGRRAPRRLLRDDLRRTASSESYLRPIAFYGYGELGVHTRDEPGRRRDHVLAVGRLPRREGQEHGIRAMVSSWQPRRAEHDPARRQGDGRVSELDARHARSSPERLRRGDHAHRPTASSPTARARRSSSSRMATSSLRTSPSASILPGITRDSIIQIAAGPRLRRRREAADPERPVHGRRGLHGRHRRRSHAGEPRSTTTRSASGPITLELQHAYKNTVTGKSERWSQWLELAPASPRRRGAGPLAARRARLDHARG